MYRVEEGKTNYEANFSYYDSRGIKCTLLSWENVTGNLWRWRTKFEMLGISTIGWTDDCWIDVYTGKAFLNEKTHQIIYYDDVDIIPKTNNSK